MSKIRLKFSKLGMGKYISHLDLLRTFTRAIHRAGVPIRYSQGFNPHQLLTFSLPLALGVTSETEFVDIDVEEGTDMLSVVKKLNENLPPDIKILEASLPQIKAKDIVSAEYIFDVLTDKAVPTEEVEKFFALKNIPTVKKTKRGEKEINLKEFVFDHEILSNDGKNIRFKAVISAGGENNVKPGLLAEKLCEYIKFASVFNTEIHRVAIFYNNGKKIENFC